jgi:hypothetical protein
MEIRPTSARRGRGVIRLVVTAIAICLAQLVLSQFLASGEAAGHAVFHALVALGTLLPALGIAWRWPEAGLASRAPALGLFAFAVAQLVESLGAFGYGPDNAERINGMVVLHDLGLGLTAVGMVVALAGIVVGIAVAANRRPGPARLVIAGGAGLLGVLGVLFIKTMIGL